MKSTQIVPSIDGFKFLCLFLPLFFANFFPGGIVYSQSPILPCNSVTPWSQNDFDVTVDFSSSTLACWDGDVLCIIPGSHPPSNAVDSDLNNFATGEILVGGFLTLSVTDQDSVFSAGHFAGFVISSGLLDANIFSNITLRTYLNNSPQETFNAFDLVGLNSALFDDPYTIGFVTTADFNEVEITFSAGIAAGLYNVHYAVIETFCQGPDLECNEATQMNADTLFPMTIDYANTGSIGINLGDVDNPENAISSSTTDFASLNDVVALLDSLSIAVKEQITDYPAGTFVGFDIQNTTLLGLDLLNRIVITSYLNGVKQQQVFGNNLLLGVPLLNNTGRQTVGFVTTTAVDEVKFTLAIPASVDLGTTLVYSAIFTQFCEGPELPCNLPTPIYSPDYPVYINAFHSGFTGAACVGCTLEDPDHVIDNDPDSYAEIDITAGVATVGSIAVRDAITDYPANTFAGFRIENVQLVDVDVLVGVTISTYFEGSFVELASGTDILLTAGTDLLVNQGEYLVGFVTTAPFDEVRISLTNIGMVNIGTTKVYEAVLGAFCPADIVCDTTYFLNTPAFPVYVDFQLTGLSGVACALCEVEDPDEVITASNTDFASITITAGVLETGSIAVRDALYVYPPGTIAGFVIEDLNDLLQADVFGSLTISTYLDGNLQEFAFGANLIDAELLILFINPDAGVYNVGFETSLPFDEIRITVGALASVINLIDVYGAFVDTRNSSGGDSLNCPNPPVAVDDMATTPEDTPVVIDVLENDSDSDSPLGIPVINDPPTHGTAMVNPGDSTVTYMPNDGFVGVDSFMYVICDDGMPPLCDTALVVVFVVPVIDTIYVTIPEDSVFTVCANELTTFTTPAVLIALCESPSGGTVTVNSACATYTLNESNNDNDTFCLVVCDPMMPSLCDTTIVIINVTAINDPPVAVDDSTSTPEDTPVVIDVLNNDSDVDSPLGVPVITDPPMHGMAIVNPVDSTVTYTPATNFVGVDSFYYAICDDGMPVLCDTALVVVTVTPVIDTIYENIPEDSTVTVCADELTTFTTPATGISLCGGPSDGMVSITGTCATYTPDNGFTGLDTFCLVVCDPLNSLLCDTTIVIITVGPLNDPPVAVDDAATTPEDTPVVIDVLNNDSDPDSPLGIPMLIDPPSHGTAIVNSADSTFTYTPAQNFVGVDSFTYAICDDGLPPLCDTALVIVTVTPVIDTIYETIPEDSSIIICADTLTTFTTPATAIALCNGPANGEVIIMGTCATYTPDAGFTGQDTFCLVVCDPLNTLLCDTTIVIITVTPVNDPPVAVDDAATTPEDTPVVIDVLDNDSDPDSPLGIPMLIDPPSHGMAIVNSVDSTFTFTPAQNFVGVDSFTYAICDDGLPPLCDTALVIITVTPVIDTIYETIPEDSSIIICADTLTTFTTPATAIALCDGPASGEVIIIGTCATYTPDAGFTGQDTFCLVVCDPLNPLLCDTTIVIITVTPVNDPPVAVDDAATTPEDSPVVIDVLSNDSDPDSPLGIPMLIDPPSHGTAIVNSVDSTFTYTPAQNFVGVDSFTYAICDDGLPPLCDSALVIVNVTPVIDTFYETIPEDSSIIICADELTTFTTPATAIALCDGPANGEVIIMGTCATYTPDAGFTGQDTFCLVVCDPLNPLLCDTTIVIITVTPVNDPPVAVDDAATTPEDTPVVIDVLDNDSDPDSPLGIPMLIDPPSHGMAIVNSVDSTFTFTPAQNFVGVDSFTYAICDDGLPPLCDTALVIVTVTPVIDTIYETTPEDSSIIICADTLTTFTTPATAIALCNGPANGEVIIMGTCATYTPDAGFTGQDTFCLVVCDPLNTLLCDTTIVIITVTPVNDPPVAVDDAATTPEDSPVVIDVLSNDSDPDSPLGIPMLIDPPSHGTAIVNSVDSTFTYTPAPNFVGVDSFTYAICDDGLPPLCDTALVIVTVTPVIDTIYETIPEDSSIIICADELTTFTTPATAIALCNGPANGEVIIMGTCATYTPDAGFTGQDTFCLVVCDPMNTLLCDTAIVIITVTPVNDPPVAVDDAATTPEDTPVVIDVLDNDSDSDSPLGIPMLIDPPSHGTAIVNSVDSTFTYTPAQNFVGVDSFTYAICDDGLPPLCDTALVVITVTPAIDSIWETMPEDSSIIICADELTTFTTPATAIALCDGPANGEVIIMGTCATYTPDAGFTGQDTFCLVVCDPLNPLLCDTTIVIITVTPVNDPPVAVDDAATTPEDIPVVIDVLDNDSDPDSPVGIPMLVDPPSHGTAIVNSVDSTFTYTPAQNFMGVDSFTYAICDDGLPPLCDTALVIVTVTPAIDSIWETMPEDSTFTVCAEELSIFTTPATSISLCGGPSDGTVTITGTCATYEPDPGYTGQDTFCLVVCDPLHPALCDTTFIIITVLPPVCFSVKAWVYLEGSCVSTTGGIVYSVPMRNTLNTIKVLPGQCLFDPFFGMKCSPPGQPYTIAPWNYPGTEGDNYGPANDILEGDGGYPSTVVDWVLVSLRDNIDGTGGPVCKAAALVHQDGRIEFTEPFECCGLDANVPYYIVIEHRNHLIVMSHEPIFPANDTLTYDFRIQQSYLDDPLNIGIYAQQKEILPGVFAMYAGNGNQTPAPQSDTDINFDDRTFWEVRAGPTGVYGPADYNLNSDTNFNDRVLWERNNGKFTSVPRN